LFFWNRKCEVLDSIPEPEVPQQLHPYQKYKTNYYTCKGSSQRESPRCKSQRKDDIGEYKIEVELCHLPRRFKLLRNLLFKTEQGFIQIDHLVISPYGLFMLEVNNLAGIIVGEESDPHWYQAITWRVKTFPNPLLENETRIKVLKEQAKLEETLPIFSYVTFNCRCNLKVISGSVVYDIDILAAILKLSQTLPEVLNDEEVLAMANQIMQVNISDPNIRNEYSARLRKQRLQKRPQYGDIRCTICQKPVSERAARYCLTHPAKFNWHIYCAKHQKEMTRVLCRNN